MRKLDLDFGKFKWVMIDCCETLACYPLCSKPRIFLAAGGSVVFSKADITTIRCDDGLSALLVQAVLGQLIVGELGH